MPTLRSSRSVATNNSSIAAPPGSLDRSNNNNNNNNNSIISTSAPVTTPFAAAAPSRLDPLTPAGDSEQQQARSSSLSASRATPQTRSTSAATAAAEEARKTRQRLGKKVLFADQQQEQKEQQEQKQEQNQQQKHYEEGAFAAENTVTERTSVRVTRRSGGRVDRTVKATARAEMADGMDKGKRKAVVTLSESEEEEEDGARVRPSHGETSDADPEEEEAIRRSSTDGISSQAAARVAQRNRGGSSRNVETSDVEEEAIRRSGSSSTDVAGDGTSSQAAARGVVKKRNRRESSRKERDSNPPTNRREASKAKFLEVARRRAAHFAHFTGEVDENAGRASSAAAAANVNDADLGRAVDEQRRRAALLLEQVSADAGRRPGNNGDDSENVWPGPFIIARQLVEGRESAAAARHESIRAAGPDLPQVPVEWKPSRRHHIDRAKSPSTLHDMCVEVLCANIEHVTSLEGVPDATKKLISALLCAKRIMTPNALRLFFPSEPGQVIVSDCTSVSEEALTEALASCSTRRLEVLELGLCGRAMSDQLCAATLGGCPGSLPVLHTLVLNGAYRLTDSGLKTLVDGAPILSTLILKQCNMISAVGLEAVAKSVGKTLKTLSLESCDQLDAIKILSPLLKMPSLESLSLSGLCEMSDGIITELAVALGVQLRELYIADCKALTDSAIKAISLCCTGLHLLDIGRLPMLTDEAIGSLADGCRFLRILRLDRGKFSDTTLASFVTASGSFLTELSLNGVRQAGNLTLTALSKYSKGTLEQLDLSFCRAVSSEALGLLADTCKGLREIHLFGCTQVTDVFVEGHSNAELSVIGLPKTVLDVTCSAAKLSKTVV